MPCTAGPQQEPQQRAQAAQAVRDWVAAGDVGAVLDLSDLNLDELPPLPANVQVLKARTNRFEQIESLPADLVGLDLHFGTLHTLTALPHGLQFLDLSVNMTVTLPSLPEGLNVLLAASCFGLGLPEQLPGRLRVLDLKGAFATNYPDNLDELISTGCCQLVDVFSPFHSDDLEPRLETRANALRQEVGNGFLRNSSTLEPARSLNFDRAVFLNDVASAYPSSCAPALQAMTQQAMEFLDIETTQEDAHGVGAWTSSSNALTDDWISDEEEWPRGMPSGQGVGEEDASSAPRQSLSSGRMRRREFPTSGVSTPFNLPPPRRSPTTLPMTPSPMAPTWQSTSARAVAHSSLLAAVSRWDPDLAPHLAKKYESHPDARSLVDFLSRLEDSRDEKNASFGKFVNGFLAEMLDNDDFADRVFPLAQSASERCGDRVTVYINDIQKELILSRLKSSPPGAKPERAVETLRTVFRLEEVRKIAVRHAALAGKANEEVEYQLAYQKALDQKLDLDLPGRTQLYGYLAQLTDGDVHAALAEVRKSEDAQFNVFLSLHPAWHDVMAHDKTFAPRWDKTLAAIDDLTIDQSKVLLGLDTQEAQLRASLRKLAPGPEMQAQRAGLTAQLDEVTESRALIEIRIAEETQAAYEHATREFLQQHKLA
ncbi:MAG TPA: NEL-type E3 ubiquitin ligase domain-containing protein [Burkholderiaceae bacterium]|nr:NEL-type E3 ubiquitin ligase domain-containing protein [Burkholderiaceae bacterium]